MKHLFRNFFVVVMGIALGGCEWGGSSDDSSWNDSQSIANFSGNYQKNGGYLVSEYTATSGSSTSSTGTTITVDGGFIPPVEEISASFTGGSISFTTDFVPIKPGSITVVFADGANGTVTDDGAGNLSGTYLNAIPGAHPANGSVVYGNGQVSIFFPDVLGLQASSVKIRYTVGSTSSSSSSSSSISSSGSAPGSSGFSIYAFNVQQSGNKLSIIDNNGSVYSGSFGDTKTTAGVGANSTGGSVANGDQVIAPFYAAGKSKSGMHVNMTGNFQGTIGAVNSVTEVSGDAVTIKTSYSLNNRVILGTWIEDGGKTGDIRGASGASSSGAVTSNVSTNSR